MDEKQLVKFKRVGIIAFLVIAAALLVFFVLFRYDDVVGGISHILDIFSPIIFGFVIAYILNPLMCVIQNSVLKLFAWRKKTPAVRTLKVIRVSSALTTVTVMLLLCYAMIALLLPQLIQSIQNILANVPTYSQNILNWYNGLVDEYAFDASSKEILTTVVASVQQWIAEQFSPQFNNLLGKVTSSVMDILVVCKNLLLGVFVSVYVLIWKDSIVARFRRALFALFNAATANGTLRNLRIIDEKFGGFLIGKILDSIIIGIMCYIGVSVMGMPYALLVAAVVGATNIIPFFGPFLGAIPSAILIGCVEPVQALYFVIFIFVLQQVDGSLLGPKILGDSVGLSSFMVLVAILIGGSGFGFVGMIAGVPLCAILMALCQVHILQRAARKNLPGNVEAYHHLDRFDPVTRQIVFDNKPKRSSSLYKRIQERSESIRAFEIPLVENGWDYTIEEVERERLQQKRDREADQRYCQELDTQRAKQDAENVQKLVAATSVPTDESTRSDEVAQNEVAIQTNPAQPSEGAQTGEVENKAENVDTTAPSA